jgi:hypothetical protein
MNIVRTHILIFAALLLVLQAGNVAARVRGGLGEEYPAEVDQTESLSHAKARRARKLERGGKEGRGTNAERELWWGGGRKKWNKWNRWGGGQKKHHWGHGWK